MTNEELAGRQAQLTWSNLTDTILERSRAILREAAPDDGDNNGDEYGNFAEDNEPPPPDLDDIELPEDGVIVRQTDEGPAGEHDDNDIEIPYDVAVDQFMCILLDATQFTGKDLKTNPILCGRCQTDPTADEEST